MAAFEIRDGHLDDGAALAAIARDGDTGNAQRLKLSRALAGKASQPRYEAFLERAPSFIAEAAPLRPSHPPGYTHGGPSIRFPLLPHTTGSSQA